jgi:hypothetical protein
VKLPVLTPVWLTVPVRVEPSFVMVKAPASNGRLKSTDCGPETVNVAVAALLALASGCPVANPMNSSAASSIVTEPGIGVPNGNDEPVTVVVTEVTPKAGPGNSNNPTTTSAAIRMLRGNRATRSVVKLTPSLASNYV